MTKRLVKSTDRKLFGVAGGVAEYFEIDATLVRIGFVVLCVCFFFLGLVAYIALAILMPSPSGNLQAADNYASREGIEDEERNRHQLLGWALVGGGLLIAVTKLAIWSWASWWLVAAALVVGGAAVLGNRRPV